MRRLTVRLRALAAFASTALAATPVLAQPSSSAGTLVVQLQSRASNGDAFIADKVHFWVYAYKTSELLADVRYGRLVGARRPADEERDRFRPIVTEPRTRRV